LIYFLSQIYKTYPPECHQVRESTDKGLGREKKKNMEIVKILQRKTYSSVH